MGEIQVLLLLFTFIVSITAKPGNSGLLVNTIDVEIYKSGLIILNNGIIRAQRGHRLTLIFPF